MTLKEQIMKLQTYKMYEGEDTVYVERDDVLKALEKQPSEDAISREVVLGIIKELPNANPSYWNTCDVIDRADLVYLVERLESVQPQRPKGKWLDKKTTIKGAHGLAYGRYGCSVCKRKFPDKSNFCPNCGSDMRGDGE